VNKKGFLLGETTLKIIIAVICIAFLIYFLYVLYFSNNGREKEEAQSTLIGPTESVKEIIKRVRENQTGEEKLIHNPDGWHLFSFVNGEVRPNSCAGDNCLCICDDVWFDTFGGLIDSRQVSKCEDGGVCLVVKDLVNKKVDIEIGTNTLLKIDYNGGIEIAKS